jgi:phospholipase C
MATRPPRRLRSEITRREALAHLGIGVTALTVGCGDNGSQSGEVPPDLAPPLPDASDPAGPPDLGGTTAPDLAEPVLTPAQLLGGIDAIVVLMMENRSFDHYLGSLVSDPKYPGKRRPDGLNGRESNPDPSGNPVTVFRMDNFTPEDPPHGWDACHRQWNGGKNDGFVKAHAGRSQSEVMGFHDRAQIPLYYALADRFTVCDRWFCSVMGPTWPNRFYLHAGTSGGKKDNSSYLIGGPTTLFERMKEKGRSAKNYFVGPVAWYMGAYPSKLFALNPCVKIDEFFSDCRNGTLPAFSIIDPDFLTNDDHPSHNIQLGQALIASVVAAIAQSPQWARTLLCITYDEHGGFHDHVPPPTAPDELADFQQLGFRVPTLLIGGTVRSAHVESTPVRSHLGRRDADDPARHRLAEQAHGRGAGAVAVHRSAAPQEPGAAAARSAQGAGAPARGAALLGHKQPARPRSRGAAGPGAAAPHRPPQRRRAHPGVAAHRPGARRRRPDRLTRAKPAPS